MGPSSIDKVCAPLCEPSALAHTLCWEGPRALSPGALCAARAKAPCCFSVYAVRPSAFCGVTARRKHACCARGNAALDLPLLRS